MGDHPRNLGHISIAGRSLFDPSLFVNRAGCPFRRAITIDPPRRMHPCLYVSDIVSQIFQHLIPPEPFCRHGDVGLHALVAVARTCKALYEPAMDALWHTIPALSPLFKGLPEDAWYEFDMASGLDDVTDDVPELRTLHLARKPLASEWDRIFQNAVRVRRVRWDVWCSCPGHPMPKWSVTYDALKILSTYCISRGWDKTSTMSFLPNMRDLRWDWSDHGGLSFTFAWYLVTDKLTTLEIRAPDIAPNPEMTCEIRPSMRAMLERCPHLQEMKLVLGVRTCRASGWEDVCEEFFDRILKYDRLHSFGIKSPVKPWHLQRLGQHPHLQRVAVELRPAHMEFLLSVPPKTLFPSLRTLQLQSLNGPDISDLCLTSISSSSLSHVDVVCLAPECDAISLRRCCKRLLSHANSLQSLTITSPDPRDCFHRYGIRYNTNHDDPNSPQSESYIIVGHTLVPLLSLHHLAHLKIHTNLHLQLTDADVAVFAEAWPKIQTLMLSSSLPTPWKPQVTLAGLLPLAEHSGELQELCVLVDLVKPSEEAYTRLHAFTASLDASTNRDSDTRLSPTETHRSGLKSLKFWYSCSFNQADLGCMAEFLVEMFPCLESFRCTPAMPNARDLDSAVETKEMWDAFQAEVDLLLQRQRCRTFDAQSRSR